MMQTSKNTNFGSWYILTVKFNLHRTRSQPWKSVKARVSTLAAPARPICNRKRWRRNGSHRHDGSAAADHHPQTIAIRAAVFSCFALELLWIRNACPAITCFKKSATQWPWKYAKSWLPGALWHGYYLKNHTGKKWLGGPWSPFQSISRVEWISHVDW